MCALSILTAHAASAAATTHILIVSGAAPDLLAGRIIVDTIESTVRKSIPSPTEFYIETVDTRRFSGEAYDRRLADLFAQKYRDIHFDLIVALGDGVGAFVLRERSSLFRDTPVLYGLTLRNAFDPTREVPDASVVFVRFDPAGTLRMARAAYPSARRALVIGGMAPVERAWQQSIEEDLRGFDPAFPITFDFESPLDTMVRRVSGLPPDSLVLFTSMIRDGANVPSRPIDALRTLSEATRVPMFGLASVHLGHGIAGGVLLDFDRHAADLAARTVQMLEGERPAAITTANMPKADWRELRRFDIAERDLPAATAIAFRQPSFWDSQKRTIGAVGIIVLVESALIVALVKGANRRRETQQHLEVRLRFERRLSNLSVSLATATPERIDEALDAALKFAADDIGADAAWVWELGRDGDAWESPAIRAGQPAEFSSPSELPRGIRTRLPSSGEVAYSGLAVPLASGGVVTGAVFWISYGAIVRWSEHADKLRVVSAVVASVLQGKRAEAALERNVRLKGAILDSLPERVAVLDRDGFIISVNDAWRESGHTDGLPAGTPIEPGSSYFDACAAASRADVAGAPEAMLCIRLACRGQRSGRQVEYRCGAPGHERWFTMTVEPLRRSDGGAVVTHSDITARKLNEIALRESEGRFRGAEQMLRDLNRRLLVAQEDERRRIARELHDHLSQQIALLAIELQQLSLQPPAEREDLAAALHEQWRRTAEIASDVHAISHQLHPSKLESLGLVATVRAHCRDLSRKSLLTHFSEHDVPARVPPETALCLFRVAEEALTNVARHSGAPEAFVTLLGTGSDIVLRVADAGSGFSDGGRAGGLGLVSMRERVEALGGAFSITSAPGQGTVVEAHVTCPSAAREPAPLADDEIPART